MKCYLMGLMLTLCWFSQNADANANTLSSMYLGSRESDPASLVENVNVIYGDYTEVEVDLIVPAPDSLILSRYYSSRDPLEVADFGGWRLCPQCYLSVQKDVKKKAYTNAEGEFERRYVCIGNPDGTILTYVGWQNTTNPSKPTLFIIDPEEEAAGLANTAKGNISSWTNLKNNKLYYDQQTDSFELSLCSQGKRFYKKHTSIDSYFISLEILPSGNKIFYEFNENGQVHLIKETNNSEQKVLAWIKFEYIDGIHVETSDRQTIDYHFQPAPSGPTLLNEVIRSDKPSLNYEYQVEGDKALLRQKTLPEGRYVQIDYYKDQFQKNKVKEVITPVDGHEVASVRFIYGDNCTEVEGPEDRKTLYRFDDASQLIAIEQYLEGDLYRVHRKSWGTKSDAGNLISTSVEDAAGNVFYYKHFTYDNKNTGNIVEEREYGDVIGVGSIPLIIDEDGLVTNHDGHIKNYAYFSGNQTYGTLQTDAKGTGAKFWYKKGTNLLLKKFILTKACPDSEEERDSGIIERHFYSYNEDAALIQVVTDDGKDESLESDWGVIDRTITNISPKQELPNVGVPEIIEEKYYSSIHEKEHLLKKTISQFDERGNINIQAIYDAEGDLRYTLTKKYLHGLLILETDPLGNETHYTYDANQNLRFEEHSDTGMSVEYGYDLRNRLISTSEIDRAGNRFLTQVKLDKAGKKRAEIDRFGNETIYENDSLGRIIKITYPAICNNSDAIENRTYTYTYDLFDNPNSITDPKGRILTKSYNVHGKPIEVNHLDGTKEKFRYDSGGNLKSHLGTNGLLQKFSYDYKGRLTAHKYFRRGQKNFESEFKSRIYDFEGFRKLSEMDARGYITEYAYDNLGRLAALEKGNRKVEFIYDALGRTHGIKKWKSAKTFTLEITEYDLLDRVIEERTEDENGKVLLKKRYIYNEAGQLTQIIGYPQNKETILLKYEYDGFGRLWKTTSASGQETTVLYDDFYINEWGQRTQRRTLIDSAGNKTEEVYDISGQLIKKTQQDPLGNVLARAEQSYDLLGNKIGEQVAVLSEKRPPGNYETEWEFNPKGQLKTIKTGVGTPEENTTRFGYNAYGEIDAKYTHGSKDPTSYQYDYEGNLEKISFKEGEDEIDYYLYYDFHDNITDIQLNSSFAITYSYDCHDLPLTEKIQDSFGAYQVTRTYDGEGKIQTIILPDGSFIEYTYEGPFIKTASRFNKEKSELFTYQVVSRDLMGNILEETLPGHLGGRKQAWDEAGRRVLISTDFFEDRVAEGGYNLFSTIKKRETTFEGEAATAEYDFDGLERLILEKAEIEHRYAFDSIGNRLSRNGSTYQINSINQLIEADGVIYKYELNGNLSEKIIGDKSWIFKSNPLNQIISIQDPDQNIVKFTYDPRGKRLTKQIEDKGKRTKVFRFFYLGDTEIGCVDEKGSICELKIPGNPNNPEAPSIAIEIKKETYVPLYDLQGNISCLVDPQKRKVIESYRYSIFGEEEIINEKGRIISDSAIGNPWRYRGKRIDKEIGLMYFGYRYYDPEIGRWISPDPSGPIDGPNLYVYAHNNPLKYIDFFGLSSTIDENCGCTKHNHPGRYAAPEGCICICEIGGSGYISGDYRSQIGGNIKSAIGGISHGIVDFAVGSLHDLQTAAAYIGTGELELALNERNHILEAIELSQSHHMAVIENWILDLFSIDASDALYHSIRSTTTIGLEVGSLIAGGYGAIKGVIGFTKMAKTPMLIQGMIKSEMAILTRTNVRKYLSNAKHLNKNKIVSDLESLGLKIQGKSPDGRFINFQDKFGNTRIKIHPSDKMTTYDHLHIYDKRGNPLNKDLKIVDKRSMESHIPYGGE